MPPSSWSRHEFAWQRAYRVAALPFGIRPATAWVEVGPEGLRARFGPWRLSTTLANISGHQRTGDYGFLKTAGPAHLSFADRGVTFATNGDEGLCVCFEQRVPAIDPTRRITHPGATFTVRDVAALAAEIDALREAAGPGV